MPTDPTRTYPSELPGSRTPRDRRVSADAAAAGDHAADVDRIGQPRARQRPAAVSHAADRRDAMNPQPDDLKKIGTIAAIRQMAKVPNGGVHVIVEGLSARAQRGRDALSGLALRATVHAGARTDRADARSRRLRPAPARADRSRAVGDERAVAGAARPGRRHRRSAAAGLPAVEPARHEGRREAADPRERQPDREAAGGGRPRSTARSRCSS